MSVALATRGMIRPCCQKDQPISLDNPKTQAVLEVRPRIRGITAPAAPALTLPVVLSLAELKPTTTDAAAPPPPSPDPRPKSTTVQELRPVTKKVEKE